MICEQFHLGKAPRNSGPLRGADRIISLKVMAPRRWDVVVFRRPDDPTIVYCSRLVGMPGETVHIDDGHVWINGEKLDFPESLAGLAYVSDIPDIGEVRWGTQDEPASLGEAEYFVLGDFSVRSFDSRLWNFGFAVPESHLIGTVTHIYWPPSRWRVLR